MYIFPFEYSKNSYAIESNYTVDFFHVFMAWSKLSIASMKFLSISALFDAYIKGTTAFGNSGGKRT